MKSIELLSNGTPYIHQSSRFENYFTKVILKQSSLLHLLKKKEKIKFKSIHLYIYIYLHVKQSTQRKIDSHYRHPSSHPSIYRHRGINGNDRAWIVLFLSLSLSRRDSFVTIRASIPRPRTTRYFAISHKKCEERRREAFIAVAPRPKQRSPPPPPSFPRWDPRVENFYHRVEKTSSTSSNAPR